VSGGRVVVSRGSENQMDDKGRIAVNDKILEYLEAGKGDMLVFLEDRGKIYLAKVDKLDVRLG
jgi:bifunctional DNA-binding transcriptional regulator/antitoxin component of YhaV-PrlF toxin-antitoxin module